MASIQTFKRKASNELLAHNNRMEDDGVIRSNDSIDPERTWLNYHLVSGNTETLNNIVNHLYTSGRAASPIMAELLVTLPTHIKIPEEDEKKLFTAALNFMRQEPGVEIVSAVVHKDETTPHLHLDYVKTSLFDPQSFSRKCSQLNSIMDRVRKAMPDYKPGDMVPRIDNTYPSRIYLKTFHKRLNDFVSKELGYDAGLINGATEKGNLSVLKLKAKTLQEEIAAATQKLQSIQKDTETLQKQADAFAEKVKNYAAAADRALEEYGGNTQNPSDRFKVDFEEINQERERRFEVMQRILRSRGIHYTAAELEELRIRERRYKKDAAFQLVPVELQPEYLRDGSCLVIEAALVNTNFHSPQMDRLIKPLRLDRAYRSFLHSKQNIALEHIDDLDVIFVRNESVAMMYENIAAIRDLLDQEHRSGRLRWKHIYAERMEWDRWDVFGKALEGAWQPTLYSTRKEPAKRDSSGKLIEDSRIIWE